jgi:glutathione S-transferase
MASGATKRAITLIDIPSALPLGQRAFSPNVWQVRYVMSNALFSCRAIDTGLYRFILNYKQIPYQTKWVAYPDLQEELKSIGAPPTRTEAPFYTAPVIVDQVIPDSPPTIVSDSRDIAKYLEEEFPNPSIFPSDPVLKLAQDEMIAAISANIPRHTAFMIISSTTQILDPRSIEYWITSRKAIFGVGVDEMWPSGSHREETFHNLAKGLDVISSLIEKNNNGGVDSWVLGGKEPSYADFTLCAQFIWLSRAGPAGAWQRVRSWNGGRWDKFWRRCEAYMQVL